MIVNNKHKRNKRVPPNEIYFRTSENEINPCSRYSSSVSEAIQSCGIVSSFLSFACWFI